ncbi:MAG: hypothetical protein ABIO70_03260 [Pseudomonadota bacterium]
MSLLSLALLVLGCATPGETHPFPPGQVLETYAVPEGYSSLMEQALTRVLFFGDEPVGRVIQSPDGRLIVVAPESVQAGVARLVDQLNAAEPAPRTPTNIRIDYWLIHGRHAEAVSTEAPAPALAQTIAAIQQAEGPMSFELYAHKVLTSVDDERARLTSSGLQIEQYATWDAAGETISAEVGIDTVGGSGARTAVQVASGQVVVLAEVADLDDDQPWDTLYYVISPTVLGAD